MTENYLHLLWRTKRLPFHQLKATTGDDIIILSVGEYNTASGPDFFNAKIRINGMIHHGNVELHLHSSDWYKHKHQCDHAYNNVILHVVLHDDKPLKIKGQLIPTIELHPFIDREHLKRYNEHMIGGRIIACENQLQNIASHIFYNQVENALIQRLERKKMLPEHFAFNNQNHIQQLVFQQLVKSFGFKNNDLPFHELANRVPFKLCLNKTKIELEALLYGIAGFLEESVQDDYHSMLMHEWNFIKHKYNLTAMNKISWKFKGCRPNGFPTIRLAQLSAFLEKMDWQMHFWELSVDQILEFFSVNLLRDVSEYWNNHYQFGKKGQEKQSKTMSLESSQLIILNGVVPFLWWYAGYSVDEKYKLRAMEILELLPPEKNRLIADWIKIGKSPKSAAESQGLLELKNEICDNRKCLNCKIGLHLLGR